MHSWVCPGSAQVEFLCGTGFKNGSTAGGFGLRSDLWCNPVFSVFTPFNQWFSPRCSPSGVLVNSWFSSKFNQGLGPGYLWFSHSFGLW